MRPGRPPVIPGLRQRITRRRRTMPRYRDEPPKKSNTGLIVALVAGIPILFCVVGVAGVVGLRYFGKKEPTKAEAKELPTRDEFRATWMGKTKDEVLAGLGKPDNTAETDYGRLKETWHYNKPIYARDPVTGKPELAIHIRFDSRGIVGEISF